jgi:hypothetical protein
VAKYQAKQAVDSFFMRAGDVVQGGIVYVGNQLGFGVPAFAAINLILSVGWITVVAALNPAYCTQVAAGRREAIADSEPSPPSAERRQPFETPVTQTAASAE